MDAQDSEKRLQDFAEAASDFFWEMDSDLRFNYLSARASKTTGLAEEVFLGKTREECGIKQDVDPKIWQQHMDDLAARRPFRNFEYPRTRPDGTVVHLSVSGIPVFDEDGQFKGYRGSTADVTERVAAETATRTVQNQFSEAIDALSDGFVLFDANDRFVTCNDRYREMFYPTSRKLVPGMPLEDWVRACTAEGHNPDAAGREEAWIAEHIQERRYPTGPKEYSLRGGRHIRRMDYRTASGYLAGLRIDITESKQAEIALRENESLLRSIIDNAPAKLDLKDLDEQYLLVNEAFARARGTTPEAMVGKTSGEYTSTQHARAALTQVRQVLETGKTIVEERDTILKNGEHYQALVTKFPIFNDAGKLDRVGSFSTDISKLKTVEKALRESERQLRLVIDSLPVLITYLDAEMRYGIINKTGAAWYARPEEDIIGRHPKELLRRQYEEWRETLEDAFRGKEITFERRVAWPDGVTRDMLIDYAPHIAADGSVAGVFCLIQDITEAKQAQEQLRRSQKIEAVAQVTGGVAHEFNNLLMAITGNLELLLEEGFQDTDAAGDVVKRVLTSAFRGKDLTSRLLSYTGNPFDRPETIDLGEKVTGAAEFLRPVLGARIALSLNVAPDLWPVKADPGEFENTLTNLAINARDAISDIGTITITVENTRLDDSFSTHRPFNVETGDYVSISFQDTGTGMSPEVVEKVFDPFYTTKGVGKGTGLGLSMVYGFVHRQSGGYIDIQSEPGKGTAVTLYFPRDLAVAERQQCADDRTALPAGGRTILLVEDDPAVRKMLLKQLKAWNYNVFAAADSTAALTLFEQNHPIDLLLSDVVLPGELCGYTLADRLSRLRPEMNVILMSGYAREDLLARGIRADRFTMLAKPYRKDDLLHALYEAFSEDIVARADQA